MPTLQAQSVAWLGCMRIESSARSTRPPSSGNTGSRLKIISVRLVTLRYQIVQPYQV